MTTVVAQMNAGSSPTQLAILALVGTSALSAAGLWFYGATQPYGPQNLADPIARVPRQSNRAFNVEASEISGSRRSAQAKNEAKRAECKLLYEDCSTACNAYPKKADAWQQCMSFCERSRDGCLEWSHR